MVIQEPYAPTRRTIRIASMGNVDSGKSTLVGIITASDDVADDGRGALRKRVFNFSHEVENGRTSSIANEIVCFNEEGNQVIPESKSTKKKVVWPDIVSRAAKVISMNDLCGHEKYLKTTMYGLSGLFPHYGMVVVGANMGIQRMTREHIGIAVSLKIPLFLVVTKIDLAPENVYIQTMEKLHKILKGSFCNMLPFNVTNAEELPELADKMRERTKVCPIFSVSNVSRKGIDWLKKFISLLEPNDRELMRHENSASALQPITNQENVNLFNLPAIFVIDSFFPNVKGVGSCLCGTMLQGKVEKGRILYIGPDFNGNFHPLIIKGIHENRVDIE